MELRYLDVIGKQAKDSVTGFSGTITAVTEWMNGCVRYVIQPNKLDKEGNPVDEKWFDSQQVIVDDRKKGIKSRVQQLAQKATPSGGPRNDPVDEW
jgi:hypothetical protein